MPAEEGERERGGRSAEKLTTRCSLSSSPSQLPRLPTALQFSPAQLAVFPALISKRLRT